MNLPGQPFQTYQESVVPLGLLFVFFLANLCDYSLLVYVMLLYSININTKISSVEHILKFI